METPPRPPAHLQASGSADVHLVPRVAFLVVEKYFFVAVLLLKWASERVLKKERRGYVSLVVVVHLLSLIQLFVTPWTAQHARFPCPSPTPGASPN